MNLEELFCLVDDFCKVFVTLLVQFKKDWCSWCNLGMIGAIAEKNYPTVFSVSRNTATRKLNKLIESGKIRCEGSGPSVGYFLYEK